MYTVRFMEERWEGVSQGMEGIGVGGWWAVDSSDNVSMSPYHLGRVPPVTMGRDVCKMR